MSQQSRVWPPCQSAHRYTVIRRHAPNRRGWRWLSFALLLTFLPLVLTLEQPVTALRGAVLFAGLATASIGHELLHGAVYTASGLRWCIVRVGMSLAVLGQPCPVARRRMLMMLLLPTALLLPAGVLVSLLGGTAAYFGIPLVILQVTGCTYDLVAAAVVLRAEPLTLWLDSEDGVLEVAVIS